MRRLTTTLGACLFLTLAGCGAADAPYNGTWKVTAVFPGQELAILLVEVQEKASGPKVKLLSAGKQSLKDADIEATRGDGDSLVLTVKGDGVTITAVAYPPKGEKNPKTMLGSVGARGERDFARWDRTDATEIDVKKATTNTGGMEDLVKAATSRDVEAKQTALVSLAKERADSALGYRANLELLGVLKDEAALRERADQAVKFAEGYGPEMKLQALKEVSRRLAAAKSPTALDYARQAEKALPADAPTATQLAVLKTLASALRSAGASDDLKDVSSRIVTIEEQLDREYLKDAMPFTPKTVPARGGNDNRVVLVELFTGAQCPPCVAADIAFDALEKTYKTSEVVLLQYHLHVPGADPLTTPDGEKRSDFYSVGGTPSFYINGDEGPPAGGGKDGAEGAYRSLVKALGSPLDARPGAKLAMTVTRHGDDLSCDVTTSALTKKGKKVRLRIALIEDVVRYPARNGQRFHHHVVRGFVGGAQGMEAKDGTQQVKLDLKELTRMQNAYLDQAALRRPFPDDDRPFDLKTLKVVAFVQDDDTKEVLQAVQADVKAGE